MPTKGPDDPLFKSFQEWFISHRQVEGFPDPNMFRQYDWGEADDYPVGPYKIERNWYLRQTLDLVQEHLRSGTFPRADYKELCELMNFILDGKVKNINITLNTLFDVSYSKLHILI